MKAFRKLIPAIVMLLISATVLGTASFAWFSMNRTVTATGMKVKAQASEALVIADSASTMRTNPKKGVGTQSSVDLSQTSVTSLMPATRMKDGKVYFDTNEDRITESDSGLLYVANPDVVDAGSGFAIDEGKSPLRYAVAENGTESKNYYVDYKVCIASSGSSALTGQNINAVLSVQTGSSSELSNSQKALSIDFYVTTISDSSTNGPTYIGTLHGTDDYYTDTGADNPKELTILTNGTIPKNNSTTDYLEVTMRVYFDGALEMEAGKAYIKSDSVDTSDVSFKVDFSADTYKSSDSSAT